MHTVGNRKENPISFLPLAALLIAGARFNDAIHRLPTGAMTFIPKGVRRFKNHEEVNQHQMACLTAAPNHTIPDSARHAFARDQPALRRAASGLRQWPMTSPQ